MREARKIESQVIYHVLNRGNGRLRLFHKPPDYAAFERVLGQALRRYPVDLLTYCLMPNHWHLVLRPRTDQALGQLMRWLGVTHVRRHHEHYHSRGGGHLYQGRYKSFPVQEDGHFLTLCRYVEANARRAGLVQRAEKWRWCGLYRRGHPDSTLSLADWPVDRPPQWLTVVNEQMEPEPLQRLRQSVNRGRPWGQESWVMKMAERLGLRHTLRPPGRPKRAKEETNE